MLDCYRVTILQRPPTCSPELVRTLFDMPEMNGFNHGSNPIRQLFTATSPAPTGRSGHLGTWLLAVVSCFTSGGPISSHFRWRIEFTDLALAAWANTETYQSVPSTALLHHLMSIEMHANLSSLQAFARGRLSAANGESAAYRFASSSIRQWLDTVDYKIAEWHAHQIMSLASATHLVEAESRHTVNFEQQVKALPHSPYCIYFATLVLWCSAINTDASSFAGWCHIQKGVSLLSTLKIRVASTLAQALQEVGYQDESA